MASFTPPPSSQLQPFTVPAPQQSDPLETLAKLRQNRLQNMQTQAAQMKMNSQRSLMKAFVTGGGKLKETWEAAVNSGDILPEDLTAFQNQMSKHETDLATLDEKTAAKVARHADLYGAMLMPNGEPIPVDQLPAINARAKAAGYFDTGKILPIEGYNDPDELRAQVNANLGLGEIAKRRKAAADIAQSEDAAAASRQQVATSLLAGQETGQKLAKGRRDQMLEELRGLPLKEGVPNPERWNKFISKYDDMDLPVKPTAQDFATLVESTIPAKDVPETRMKANMAAQGMTGTTYWDQYLFNEAQALGKKPAELTPIEKRKIFNDFKKLEENPVLTALGETNKRLTNQVLGAQVAGILTPAQIDSVAQELLSGDMAPDQIKELKPGGRVNQGGQVIQRARELAKAAGKPFSFMELEMAANQREKTLNEFNSTLVSHIGGQRLALNVLIHHADLYMDAAAALKNNTFRPGNEVYNKISAMMGSPAPSNAALIAQFFASETGKVATGGVPAEGEIRAILQNLGTSGSPEAMEGAGKTLMGIAAGRMIPMKALRDRNRLQKFVDILDPDSTEILERRGFDPETMKPKRAGGGKYKVGDTVMYQGKPRKIISIDPKTGKLRLQMD